MKKETNMMMLAILAIVIAKPDFIFSQVTTPSNFIGTSDYVGSSNAVDVVFKAKNTESMRILQSNGNFGIGKTPQLPRDCISWEYSGKFATSSAGISAEKTHIKIDCQ